MLLVLTSAEAAATPPEAFARLRLAARPSALRGPRVVVTAGRARGGGAWLPARVAQIVAERLARLGLDAPEPDLLLTPDPAFGPDVVRVRLSASPEDPEDADQAIDLALEISGGGLLRERIALAGRAGNLEDLAAHAADDLARRLLGSESADPLRARLEATYPFAIHRHLGRAARRLEGGERRRALILYGRAGSFSRELFVPEAIEGQARSEGALVALDRETYGRHAALAAAAAQRAQVALQRRDLAEAEKALESFLRYTTDRARRFAIEAPIEEERGLVPAGGRWIVQAGGERFAIDPRTGVLLGRAPRAEGLVGSAGEHSVVLRDGRLARLDPAGRVRWSMRPPVAVEGPAGVFLTSGLIGLMAPGGVAWVDLAFGKAGQVALGVRPLAASSGGIVVWDARGERRGVALLRPGRKTPAWTFETEEPRAAKMTRERVLLLFGTSLALLGTHDGERIKEPLEIAPSSVVIGADGRQAVLASAEGGLVLFDILSGHKTAAIEGPGRGIAAVTTSEGAAVLFEGGDLLFFEREGRLLDRARVPGRPLGLVPGHPMAPGPVAITDRGIYAFTEPRAERDRMRDVDAYLALARIHLETGRSASASNLLSRLALRSAGRAQEIESLRAEIYEKSSTTEARELARRARARAALAADPTAPLAP